MGHSPGQDWSGTRRAIYMAPLAPAATWLAAAASGVESSSSSPLDHDGKRNNHDKHDQKAEKACSRKRSQQNRTGAALRAIPYSTACHGS